MVIGYGYYTCTHISPMIENQAPHHVMMFIPNLSIGGAEKVFITLCKQFITRGHRITLVVCNNTQGLVSELPKEVEFINLNSISQNGNKLHQGVKSVYRLASTLKKIRPDIVLSTLTGANLTALLAVGLSGIHCKTIVREAAPLRNTKSITIRILKRFIYKLADAIVVLNNQMRVELTRIGIREQKIHNIPNPIETDHILNLSNAHPIDLPNKPYIVAIGRLVDAKDFKTLIHAYKKLPTKIYPLFIIGEGPERKKIEQLINNYKLNDSIFLLGEKTNPYPWLRHAKIFVSSSLYEGHPNAIIEAMLFNVPIIATACNDSIFDILSPLPRENYEVVPPSDPELMAKAIYTKLDCRPYLFSPPDPTTAVIDAYENIFNLTP